MGELTEEDIIEEMTKYKYDGFSYFYDFGGYLSSSKDFTMTPRVNKKCFSLFLDHFRWLDPSE